MIVRKRDRLRALQHSQVVSHPISGLNGELVAEITLVGVLMPPVASGITASDVIIADHPAGSYDHMPIRAGVLRII